jgi:hypothetical protein
MKQSCTQVFRLFQMLIVVKSILGSITCALERVQKKSQSTKVIDAMPLEFILNCETSWQWIGKAFKNAIVLITWLKYESHSDHQQGMVRRVLL